MEFRRKLGGNIFPKVAGFSKTRDWILDILDWEFLFNLSVEGFHQKMRVIVSLMSDTTGRWKIRWQFGENIYLTVGYWLQYIKSGVEILKVDI